eukprot:tig00000194_g14803.t1
MSNAGGSSLEASRQFATVAGPAPPRIAFPATDGAIDVERTNDGFVSVVLSTLGLDAVTSATVACISTASQTAVDPVTVSGLSAPTSITVRVLLAALTGYQCTVTTANAGGTSTPASRTFVTKKGLAPVDAKRSVASGPAACGYQVVGWITTLVVQAFDAEGLVVSGRNAGTLSAKLVSLTGSDPRINVNPAFSYYGTPPAADTSADATITNFQNGTFLVEFQVPRRRGTYELELALATGVAANSGPIANSPLRFFALPSTQTKVSFEGVSTTVKALKGFPVSFSGIYRDSNDNFMGGIPAGVATSTCPAAFSFRSSAGTATTPPAIASISASPATPVDLVATRGTYGMGGTWFDTFVLTGKTTVDGSATVTVTGAVGASTSTVTTISLTAGDIAISKSGVFSSVCKQHTAGRAFSFRIELRDAQDARVDGFSVVTVTPTYLGPTSTAASIEETVFALPDGFKALVNPNAFPSAATATVASNTDGSFTASVTAFKAGYYKLAVSINGQAAGVGSGFTVFVNPGEPAPTPDAAYPFYSASGVEWVSSARALAGQTATTYVAIRDAFGNLVEPSAYQTVAESEVSLKLGFASGADATGCSSAIPSPWTASTLSLVATDPAIVRPSTVLPVVATTGLGTSKSWNYSEQSATPAGVYRITFSTCSTGALQIRASRSGVPNSAFGAAVPLTVTPNVLASIQDASALKESVAGPLAAEAASSIRVTGVDACGNVVDFNQCVRSCAIFDFTQL